MSRRSGEALFAALLVATGACSREPTSTEAPSATVRGPGTPSSSPSAFTSKAAVAPASEPSVARQSACRIVTLEGALTMAEAPLGLAVGALLLGEDWLSLAPGGSVTLKHTTSAREFRVDGPALFRACRGGREQILFARGTVKTTPGAGARPGAEAMIATPVALVRYGDAELTLRLDEKKLGLDVRAGAAEVEEAKRPREVKRISGKQRVQLELGKVDPEAQIAACQSAAEAAENSARILAKAATMPVADLADRAKDHVRGRKAARAACAIAAAATGLMADGARRQRSWDEVSRWEGLWETVPRKLEPTVPGSEAAPR